MAAVDASYPVVAPDTIFLTGFVDITSDDGTW